MYVGAGEVAEVDGGHLTADRLGDVHLGCSVAASAQSPPTPHCSTFVNNPNFFELISLSQAEASEPEARKVKTAKAGHSLWRMPWTSPPFHLPIHVHFYTACKSARERPR